MTPPQTPHTASTPELKAGIDPTTPDMPEHFQARIQGEVQHRVGDGPTALIPLGQTVQVDVAIASMVLSWTSEGQPVTVTLAREEFLLYVDSGAIRVLLH